MNQDNRKKLSNWIASHQFNLSIRLPDEPDMKYARNGWCHLYGVLLDAYQLRGVHDGIKMIPDSEFDNCIKLLEIAYQYGEDPNVYDRLPKVDQKVIDSIHNKQTTLDDWFVSN